MDSCTALPWGDSSSSRCASTIPIFGSAQAGSAAREIPAAIAQTTTLLLIKRITDLPTSVELFVVAAGPREGPGRKRLVSRRTPRKAAFFAFCRLESVTHGELEALGLIGPGQGIDALKGVQRDPVAEPEQAQGRQPLHRNA